jgi:hypothetical protein
MFKEKVTGTHADIISDDNPVCLCPMICSSSQSIRLLKRLEKHYLLNLHQGQLPQALVFVISVLSDLPLHSA